MALELNLILVYVAGLILLYTSSLILMTPLRWIIKLIWRRVLGGLILFFINLIGGFLGIYLAINPFSAMVVGILGLPGVVLLLLLKHL